MLSSWSSFTGLNLFVTSLTPPVDLVGSFVAQEDVERFNTAEIEVLASVVAVFRAIFENLHGP